MEIISCILGKTKTGEDGYPIKFFQANEIHHHLAGIWLYNPKKLPFLHRLLQVLWSVAVYVVCFYFIILEFLIFKETVRDVNKFISQVGLLLCHSLGIARVLILLTQHKKLQELEDSLEDTNYHYEAWNDFNPGKLLSEAKILSSRFVVLIYCLYSCVGVSAYISAEIVIQKEIKEERLDGNVTCYDYMPYYFLIPWDPTTKTNCRRANLFMSYCLAAFAWFISCHDGVYAALLNCLKTQLVIICGAIKTIRPRVMRRLSLSENFEILHDEDNPNLEKELYRELNHITEHLIILLKVADGMENIFTFLTLGQTVTSIIIFASCLFVAASVPITSPIFFAQSEYFMCTFLQLSMFCWFGSGITVASEDIMFALYDCNWYSASKRFKSSLVTVMCRMQRPIYLTIGKFSPLTLNAIVTVCKGSFSYYAVFKTVKEE